MRRLRAGAHIWPYLCTCRTLPAMAAHFLYNHTCPTTFQPRGSFEAVLLTHWPALTHNEAFSSSTSALNSALNGCASSNLSL